MAKHVNSRVFSKGGHLFAGGSAMSSIILMIVSVVFMAISAFKPQAFDFARSNVSNVFAPVLAVVSIPLQKVSMFSHDITNFAQLQADNAHLTQENERLRYWYQTALLLDSENKSLRKLLNVVGEDDFEHVSGRVIADSGSAYVKSVMVNIGERQGLKNGDAVLSGDGLAGRVIEVGSGSSRILLVTDMNSRIPVVVEDTGQHAILSGTNDTIPQLIHVPPDSKIADGARIITAGYGGVFPHGLPVGRAQLDPDGLIEVILFSDFDKLQIVRVLRYKTTKRVR